MAPAEAPAPITVEVVYSPRAGCVDCVTLVLNVGATASQAARLSGLAPPHGPLPALGVWGRRCGPDQVLGHHDRVEIYRPLQVDPKQARRQRHAQHLARFGPRRRVK